MKKQSQQVSLASFFKRGGTIDPPQPGKTASSAQSSSNAPTDQNPAVRKTARQLPGTVLIQNLNQSRKAYESNGGGYNRMGFRAAEERPDIDLSKQYKLSVSQKRVLDAIMRRRSVFFTGAAGTGKSYVVQILRSVIEALQWEDKIAYTAPTGVAACNIRGLTIHSWAGVGKASEPIEQLLPIVLRNSNACKRWRETEILVIDEISMLSAELFDKLDIIGRRVRNNINPFGGLQVIVCGDFFQLPPVGLGKTVKFCFEAQAWKSLFEEGRDDGMIMLDKVFRQKDDTTFLNLLNEMREGEISIRNQQLLQRKVEDAQRWMQQEQQEQAARGGDGFFQSASTVAANNREKKLTVRPTKLFSTNHDVDQYNMTELERLQKGGGGGDDDDKEPVIYFAVDQGKDPYLTQIKSGTKAPEKLYLKKGAQVMLLKNLDTERGLVNGARGTVVDFERSNGRTSFCSLLPVVNFTIIMGSTRSEERVVLTPETWEVKLGETVLASRQQIPLMLAWAISIHKSQGMTIPLLEVSFNRMFEFGQAYVALSRATSLQGLTLHSFQAQSIRAHPLVKDFYREIAVANQRRLPPQHQQQQQQYQHQPYAMTSPPAVNDDVLEVCLRDFVNAFQVDFDPKAVDHDQWIESRGRPTTTTSMDTTHQRQRVEERRYEDTTNRSQFVPPNPSFPPSSSYQSQSQRPMVADRPPSADTMSTATTAAVSGVRKPSGLLNSSFSAASFARPMNPASARHETSGFQDAGHSNAHGDDWLDQDFMAKKRAEAAQRIAAMEQQYLLQSTAAANTAVAASFVPHPPPGAVMRHESPPTISTLMPHTTLVAAAPSSAPSSSSKNKEVAVEVVILLDSADEDSIPFAPVPTRMNPAVVSTMHHEPPKINDFGGYGSQPHLTCNESPLNRVLHPSTTSSSTSNGHAPLASSSSSSSEPVTVGNGVVLTDSLKRKLEENRQRALEKLEKFKKSRLEQSSSHI